MKEEKVMGLCSLYGTFFTSFQKDMFVEMQKKMNVLQTKMEESCIILQQVSKENDEFQTIMKNILENSKELEIIFNKIDLLQVRFKQM